jgi:ribosomal peptide maturation radical SAM protein 1
MTLKIALVNMPFGVVQLPSIAMTQLRSVVQKTFGSSLSISSHYFNHEIAQRMSQDVYQFVCESGVAHVTGLGDWLFRNAAFPDEVDNTREYFARYGNQFGQAFNSLFTRQIEPFRAALESTIDELIERHGLHEAQIVGLTSMFSQNVPSIALARRLRRRNPDVIIVMGGANCEGSMGVELVNNVDVLDFVFSGPGLISFSRFVGHVLRGEKDRCHEIDGVLSRRNSVSVTELKLPQGLSDASSIKPEQLLRGIRPYGSELPIDTPIDLDYDGFFESLARTSPEQQRSGAIFFETSRGCWWGERAHCTFCGLNGTSMSYRAMRADLALQHIRDLVARYSNRARVFQSVDNIMPRDYCDAVFGKLDTPEDVELFYEVKADLTEPQVATLAKARVLRIQPGIESLATSTLKLMRKGTTSFHNLRLLKYCKQYGITPEWNLLMGFPGEQAATYERYKRVLPTLFHLPPPMGTFTVRFDRFSPYFMTPAQWGLKLAPYDYYAMCYPFPADVLMNMAYFYIDLNFEADYARDAALWIGEMRNLVARWQSRWRETDKPALFLKDAPGQRQTLVDTRSGARRVYPLSDQENGLLSILREVTIETEVPAEYSTALNALRTRGITFSERGRIMSITGSA